MKNFIIEKTIAIHATIANVWSVFTNPEITKKMGGKYVTDWRIGSSFNFQGNNGEVYTQGKILALIPEKLLKHELYDLTDHNKFLSLITYEFTLVKDLTVLTATEILNYDVTDQQLVDINLGWDAALKMVKNISEGLTQK